MTTQPALFTVEPRYCVDTNVVVSFLSRSDDEFYGSDVFAPQWSVFDRLITNGQIVAPSEVRTELEKWAEKNESISRWLHRHNGMFRGPTTEQLALAKRIVNTYPAYGRDRHYLGDLMVVSLAGVLGLTVITLERSDGSSPSRTRPKIPFTCSEFGILATGVAGFLRREQP
jgi:hypothetical protein